MTAAAVASPIFKALESPGDELLLLGTFVGWI